MSSFAATHAHRPIVVFPHLHPTRRMLGALRALVATSSSDARPAPRHYPPLRSDADERCAMAREMYRL